jgi:hypothetical protein
MSGIGLCSFPGMGLGQSLAMKLFLGTILGLVPLPRLGSHSMSGIGLVPAVAKKIKSYSES